MASAQLRLQSDGVLGRLAGTLKSLARRQKNLIAHYPVDRGKGRVCLSEVGVDLQRSLKMSHGLFAVRLGFIIEPVQTLKVQVVRSGVSNRYV